MEHGLCLHNGTLESGKRTRNCIMVTAVILPSNIRNHNGQAYADWSDWQSRTPHALTAYFITHIEHSFNYKYGGHTANNIYTLFAAGS